MTTTLAPPSRRSAALRSTVARKQLMAVTGLILFGFVLLHMVGMLKFFFGADDFDHYSHWLRTILSPLMPHEGYLWLQRGALSLAVALHIWAATSLTLQSRRARPVKYAQRSNVQATYASRTMRWGGVIIVLFVIYHLLDLSIGTANPGYVKGEVFRNTIASLKQWPVAIAYIVAVGAVCLHLYHGVWSMCQTLGVNKPQLDRPLRNLSKTIALVIFAGFISVPVAILAGFRG